jgi:hypothetical protein
MPENREKQIAKIDFLINFGSPASKIGILGGLNSGNS